MEIELRNGALTQSEFKLAARTFAERWNNNDANNHSASPSWLWIDRPNPSHMDGYLALENFCMLQLVKDNSDDVVSGNEEEGTGFHGQNDDVGCFDDATLQELKIESSNGEVRFYDFHIVYSPSYMVPVLYFRGHSTDGRPLLMNEIEKDLPACSANELLKSKWTFITQEEHPYLNRPWYKLHPCGTAEWMKLLFLNDTALTQKDVAAERYLVSWFSVVGQVVGLRIPIEMAKGQM